MWGSVGITYNIDMVQERLPDAKLNSLDMLLKPENAAKLADCGISMLDSPTDVILMVLRYLGKDGDTDECAGLPGGDRGLQAGAPVHPHLRQSNYLNAIPNKELCVDQHLVWRLLDRQGARAQRRGWRSISNITCRRRALPPGSDCLCIPADARTWAPPTSSSTTCCSPR